MQLYVVYNKSYFKYKDTAVVKIRELTKINHANSNQKKTAVVILISEKADFRARRIIRGKEGHYIITKGSILQEYIQILNMYASKNT